MIQDGPQITRRKRFHKFFSLREDIRLQNFKIACLRSQRLCGQANFSFRLLLLGLYTKLTKVPFFHDYSFKICEKPSKFSKSVHVVFVMSA